MASRLVRRSDEGFSLVELLVVIVVMGIVAAATLSVVITTQRAQRAAADTRVKLDGTRIAVQRVREELREADEICSDSDATNLRMWVDADDNGNFDPTEIVVYRLIVNAAGDDVFERFVPATGATRLIRGDVLNAALFTYDVVPGDQLDLLQCDVRTVTDPARTERTTVVGLEFTIATAAGQGIQNLSVDSAVRLRNAGVFEIPPNQTPTASFTYVCTGGYNCAFDATASSDPDGSIAMYDWEFGDASTDSQTTPTTNHTYASSPTTVTVSLTVTDDRGGTHTTSRDIALPVGNNPPSATIGAINCAATSCTFAGTGSSDPDGDTLYYLWDFGDLTTAGPSTSPTSPHTYGAAGTYTVTLTVRDRPVGDPSGLTATTTQELTVAAVTYHLSALTGNGSKTGNNWRATVTVSAHNNAHAAATDGTTISVRWLDKDGATLRTDSCATAAGKCTFLSSQYDTRSNKPGYQPKLTLRVVTIGGSFYNPSSNEVDPPEFTVNVP